MSSPLPSNMAMTTVRGRYGQWNSDQFVPFVGLQVRFAPAYPFVTNTTATPSPLVIATAPRTLQTDADGYLSDPDAGFDSSGMGLNRNAKVVSSDDPDIEPHDWPYLVTFHGPGATNFRAFRTPLPSDATVDIAILTPQRVASGTAPTQAEIAAANSAASAADAQAAVASIRRGQIGGVAPLDADGDVNDAAGHKILGGGSGGTPDLAVITGMSVIGKQIVATNIAGVPASAAGIRNIIGAGTGNSNLTIGTVAGTAADAQVTNTAIGQRPLDAVVVHKTGDETIAGHKSFSDTISIVTGTAADNPVTKAQLDTLTTTVNTKVGRNGAGVVDAADIDTVTIARKSDITAAIAGIGSGGTVTKSSIGLGNVDNTADIDKPVSSPALAMFARIRVPWKQVGTLYPTPVPTGFYGIAYEGVNDPVDQAGLIVTNNDTWTQTQA